MVRGEISATNKGHTTEKAPEANPWTNHPKRMTKKLFTSEIAHPVIDSKLNRISPLRLPSAMNLLPNNDPKVPPRGTIIEIIEL
jgi:hypothetical protein